MDRFPDYIKIYRHSGDIYNPFHHASQSEETDNSDTNDTAEVENSDAVIERDGITLTKVYEGECKIKTNSQNSMMAVAERANLVISVNEPNINVDARDTIYYTKNGGSAQLKATVLDKQYCERNTLIYAMQLKDGENS